MHSEDPDSLQPCPFLVCRDMAKMSIVRLADHLQSTHSIRLTSRSTRSAPAPSLVDPSDLSRLVGWEDSKVKRPIEEEEDVGDGSTADSSTVDAKPPLKRIRGSNQRQGPMSKAKVAELLNGVGACCTGNGDLLRARWQKIVDHGLDPPVEELSYATMLNRMKVKGLWPEGYKKGAMLPKGVMIRLLGGDSSKEIALEFMKPPAIKAKKKEDAE